MSTLRTDNLRWWVIPNVLAGMAMPFVHPLRRMNLGGALSAYEDELPCLYEAGIRAVVSLLNLPSDVVVFESAGFRFLCLPIPDGGAPSPSQAKQFVQFVNDQRREGRPNAVHCEAGLGRTGTLLAAYLISEGHSSEEAIRLVREAEPGAVETKQQVQFLADYANALPPQPVTTPC